MMVNLSDVAETTSGRSQARLLHCTALCVKSPSLSSVQVVISSSLIALLREFRRAWGRVVGNVSMRTLLGSEEGGSLGVRSATYFEASGAEIEHHLLGTFRQREEVVVPNTVRVGANVFAVRAIDDAYVGALATD